MYLQSIRTLYCIILYNSPQRRQRRWFKNPPRTFTQGWTTCSRMDEVKIQSIFQSHLIHAFFLINTSAISTSSLRFGQKISTFCASPLRLADVKYQFSRYGTPKARAFATFIIIQFCIFTEKLQHLDVLETFFVGFVEFKSGAICPLSPLSHMTL